MLTDRQTDYINLGDDIYFVSEMLSPIGSRIKYSCWKLQSSSFLLDTQTLITAQGSMSSWVAVQCTYG